MRALVVSTAKRVADLPDVPTPVEIGLKDGDSAIWFGVFVPAKTPRDIVEKLHAAGEKVLTDPVTQASLKKLGVEPMPMSPAEMDDLVKRETAANLELIKAAGIKQPEGRVAAARVEEGGANARQDTTVFLPPDIPPMSALFSPIKLRGLTLPNRIMVSPMCQYSSVDGEANDWHFTHINSLALSGAAMFCIEATHVEAIGRITPGCLGLWNDATEAALKPILASVRKRSKAAVAMQLAHAGRKGSSHTPWDGGQLIPVEGGWQPVGPSAIPHKQNEPPPWRSIPRARAYPRCIRVGHQTCRTARDRRHRSSWRARLPLASVPVADRQPADRSIWRVARKPDALSAGGVRCGTRGVSRQQAGGNSGFLDRLGRGWLGSRADHRIRAGAEEARRRLDRCVLRRRLAVAENPARPRLSGAVRAGDPGSYRAYYHRGRVDHGTKQAEETVASGKADMVALARGMLYDPRWGWHAAAELGGTVDAPPQYWRSQPSTQKALFGATTFGTR